MTMDVIIDCIDSSGFVALATNDAGAWSLTKIVSLSVGMSVACLIAS